ncbi:glycosyltransferase family 39 protein [Candidatus Shapirobacteria bacterium]|nr:glycosyltransferase family 39 protein [Candidatus Shapirobacteria bacterium]
MSFSSVVLILLTLFTRFFGLNWGGGFFFNPDENNMVQAIMRMSPGNLNPHFFAYGQFPLYLSYFTRNLLGFDHSYEATTYVLRFWSAMFSSISVLFFYIIVKKIFNSKVALYATLLYIFTPGLIQLSHFGTTESLLILVFLANIYLSLHLVERPLDFKTYLLSSVTIGIGMASKLSSLIFTFPVLLVSLFNLLKQPQKLRILFLVFYFLLFTLIFFIIFSPYNLVENKDFLSALRYETEVATGKMHVFYTNQFTNTLPYIFQLTHIFPHVLGLPIFIFSVIGMLNIIHKPACRQAGHNFINHKSKVFFIIVLSSCLIYFLYFGQLYVKWTRFMSPIFFIFPFLASICIAKIDSKLIRTLIIFASIVPALYFLRLYTNPDIRVTASEWMNANIPINSKVFSEGGNVIDIPLDGGKLDITNFDFYSLENNPQSKKELINKISEAEYILIPSRRVFMNQVGPSFSSSHSYYQALFNGSLGFEQLQSFQLKTDLFLNQEMAEETWTVFDRPTIRVYKKVNNLSLEDYEKLLNH